MRIALTDFHHGWGGQANQVLLLAQAHMSAGHEVLVLSPAGSEIERRAQVGGIATAAACAFARGFRPVTFVRDVLAFRACMREHRVDVVHCHGSQDSWVACAARACGGAYALVRTKHNSYPAKNHCMNRWMYGSAFDRVICVAGAIRTALLDNGVGDPARTVAIHAGLPDAFGADVPVDAAAAVRKEFDCPPEALLIGIVARLAADKGQALLLQALPAILRQHPDAYVMLVGKGAEEERLQALAQELGVAAHVRFAGFRTDIARLTAAFSVAVLASTDCDASSTVMKEAMCLGVPVVGADVGGTSEILDDGTCGRVVMPGNAKDLAVAISDTLATRETEAMAQRIARARLRVTQEYAMSAVAARTREVYEEAMACRAVR